MAWLWQDWRGRSYSKLGTCLSNVNTGAFINTPIANIGASRGEQGRSRRKIHAAGRIRNRDLQVSWPLPPLSPGNLCFICSAPEALAGWKIGSGLGELNRFTFKKMQRASLVAQWLRICLLMQGTRGLQGTRVRALVWEDPTCRGATRPVSHNYWACASGACALQQEKPLQWEACAPRWRVAPTCHN